MEFIFETKNLAKTFSTPQMITRIPHTLELLADSFLQAGVYALLLRFPSKVTQATLGSYQPATGL